VPLLLRICTPTSWAVAPDPIGSVELVGVPNDELRKRYLTVGEVPLRHWTRSVNCVEGEAEPGPLKLLYAISLPSRTVLLPLPMTLGVEQVVGGGGGGGGGGGVETEKEVLISVVRYVPSSAIRNSIVSFSIDIMDFSTLNLTDPGPV